MDFTKRAVKRLGSDLAGHESVQHGIYAMPPGSIARGLNERPDMRGAISGALEKRNIKGEDGGSLAQRIPPESVFLTITNKRLFVHKVTKSGKPSDYLGEYSPGEITAVDSSKGRMGGGQVVITFADASEVDFMVKSGQDVDRFEATWHETVASG